MSLTVAAKSGVCVCGRGVCGVWRVKVWGEGEGKAFPALISSGGQKVPKPPDGAEAPFSHLHLPPFRFHIIPGVGVRGALQVNLRV